jgi:hypothetical protein
MIRNRLFMQYKAGLRENLALLIIIIAKLIDLILGSVLARQSRQPN